MCYDVRSVAAAVLDYIEENPKLLTGRELTNLDLQKIVYLLKGSYLTYKEEPLFENAMIKWKYGPAVPDLFYQIDKSDLFDKGLREKLHSFGVVKEEDKPYIAECVNKYFSETPGYWYTVITKAPSYEKIKLSVKISDSVLKATYRCCA